MTSVFGIIQFLDIVLYASAILLLWENIVKKKAQTFLKLHLSYKIQ